MGPARDGGGSGSNSDSDAQFLGSQSRKVLHTFNIATVGDPVSGLAMDANGNLYGTTRLGGPGGCSLGCGVVFKLSKNSQGGFAYSVLHTFAGFPDGGNPFGAPIVDSAGNVYGTTTDGGKGDCGIVYRLSLTTGRRVQGNHSPQLQQV